jgi:hypothetical protein
MEPVVTVLIGSGVLLFLIVVFWVVQFIDLMLMPDEDFPGRFDKVLWVAVFLVLFFLVAPLAFGLWKETNKKRLRNRPRPIPAAPDPAPPPPTAAAVAAQAGTGIRSAGPN